MVDEVKSDKQEEHVVASDKGLLGRREFLKKASGIGAGAVLSHFIVLGRDDSRVVQAQPVDCNQDPANDGCVEPAPPEQADVCDHLPNPPREVGDVCIVQQGQEVGDECELIEMQEVGDDCVILNGLQETGDQCQVIGAPGNWREEGDRCFNNGQTGDACGAYNPPPQEIGDECYFINGQEVGDYCLTQAGDECFANGVGDECCQAGGEAEDIACAQPDPFVCDDPLDVCAIPEEDAL